jgi:hypothetical protein
MMTTETNSKRGKGELARPDRRAEGLTGEGNGEEMAARAAAMLPAELLQPSEIIILLLKPSPWFIVLAPLRTLTILLILTLATLLVHSYYPIGLTYREIIMVGLALGGVRVFWQFLEWISRVYVLTDQRVVRVQGVLRILVFETPLKQIQHTTLLFSVRERLFGLGTIGFATAGTAFVEAYWTMVSQPLAVHQKVVATINRYKR